MNEQEILNRLEIIEHQLNSIMVYVGMNTQEYNITLEQWEAAYPIREKEMGTKGNP